MKKLITALLSVSLLLTSFLFSSLTADASPKHDFEQMNIEIKSIPKHDFE